MNHKKIHTQGFTLAELLVTISIVSILATMGVPSLQGMLQNNKMVARNNELLTALSFARGSAVTRGSSVTVCKRNVAGTGCNSEANWEDGWVVFEDNDSDGVVDANAGETILSVYHNNDTNLQLRYNRDRLTYNGQGFSSGFGGNFLLCDTRGDDAKRGIVITFNGRIRMAERSELPDCPEAE